MKKGPATLTRKQEIENEKKAIFAKDYVKNNLVFTNEHISDFYDMFKLLADYRTNKIYVSEILETAKTLGIHDKYKIVFRCLQRLQEDIGDDEAIDFETFIKELTQRIGTNTNVEGRKTMFELIAEERESKALSFDELRDAAKQGHFNLNDDEIQEVIKRVGGADATEITYDQFERYLGRKVDSRNK